MSKARQLADLLDGTGDVSSGELDNVPPKEWSTLLNKPSHANVDKTNAANISSGTIPNARIGNNYNGSTGVFLRGDGNWIGNCSNHPNCAACIVSNCACACACNC